MDYLIILPPVGLGISVAVTYLWLYQDHVSKFSPSQIIKSTKVNDAFQRWIGIADKRLRKANAKVNAAMYVSVVAITGALAFISSLYLFHNFTAAVFLTLAFILLPDHMLNIFINKRRKQIAEQLAQAIRIFAAEYIQTPQLSRGFAAIAERVPNPVGKIFREAHYHLITGRDPELVLAGLMGKIDIEHGRMFIQLLQQAKDDASVTPLFGELVKKLEDFLDLWSKNTANLSGERTLSMIMAVIPIPAYLFMVRIIPETTTFLVENNLGRVIISLAFGSIFIWTLLDRLMGVDT